MLSSILLLRPASAKHRPGSLQGQTPLVVMKTPEPNTKRAAKKIWKSSKLRPRLAIILGSGFHHFAGELDVETALPFTQIPGFQGTGIRGHAGELLLGHLGKTPVLVLNGRVHYYEGVPMSVITFRSEHWWSAGSKTCW